MLPMLAHDFKKQGHRMLFPCYGQPKLDGFRCLFHSEIGFWSRGGKPFDACVDLSHLQFDTQGHTIDGELMLPKGYTFQQTCQAIKKQRDETALLEFHIFDVVLDRGFQTRRKCLASMVPLFPRKAKLVPTFEVTNREHAAELMAQLTEQGHEGLMLRSPLGEYEIGQRSASLQKYKEFLDEEFAIVDVIEGVGREEGAAIFVCQGAGGRFNVRPKGDYGTRQEWFRNKNALVGRQLTVRYQNLTDDGLPRFPVGIALREDWDR
jgi:DNA ligase-1